MDYDGANSKKRSLWGMQEARKKDGRDLFSRWLFLGLRGIFFTYPWCRTDDGGYANGQVETTNYQLIKETDHAETVQVIYDPNKITLRAILLYYFRVIDPLSINKQGNDRGRQYRTGVYYLDEADREVIAQVFAEEEKQLGSKIAVELEPLRHYILAEDYHQDYLKKNPGGYCHIDVTDAEQPLIDPAAYQKPDQEILKAKLTAEQYQVTQEVRRNVLSTMPMIRPSKRASMWILRRGSHSSLPRISLRLAVDGQVSPVPLPKMSSTITRIIATGWNGSKFVPAQAMPTSAMSSPMDQKTKVAYAIVSIRPLCALFQKKRWSKKDMVIC